MGIEQGSASVFCRGQTVNIFDFAGHKVIFVIVVKAAGDNT